MAEPQADVDNIPQDWLGHPVDEKRSETGQPMPDIVFYQDREWQGKTWRTNLSYYQLGDWNDRISGMIIVSGIWEFYEDSDYRGRLGDGSQQFGPGYYEWVEAVGIPNDTISSFKCVARM